MDHCYIWWRNEEDPSVPARMMVSEEGGEDDDTDYDNDI